MGRKPRERRLSRPRPGYRFARWQPRGHQSRGAIRQEFIRLRDHSSKPAQYGPALRTLRRREDQTDYHYLSARGCRLGPQVDGARGAVWKACPHDVTNWCPELENRRKNGTLLDANPQNRYRLRWREAVRDPSTSSALLTSLRMTVSADRAGKSAITFAINF